MSKRKPWGQGRLLMKEDFSPAPTKVLPKSLGTLIDEAVGDLIIAIGRGNFRDTLVVHANKINSQAFKIGFDEGAAYQKAKSRLVKRRKKKK